MKPVQIALLLALFLPVAMVADAQQNKSSSYKSGFSSQKSSSARSGSSFGSFGASGGRSAVPPPRAPQATQPARHGGFGSFGSMDGAATPHKSDSALSQRLNKNAAQTNAVNTLESRRRAEQDAMNAAARPVPSGPLPRDSQYGGRTDQRNTQQYDQPYGQRHDQRGYQGMPAPVVIQQHGNGIGSLITGFLLAKATSPARATSYGYPGRPAVAGTPPAQQGSSFFMSMLRTLAWLVILSIVGWAVYFGWKFLRRGRAPSQANYSFER